MTFYSDVIVTVWKKTNIFCVASLKMKSYFGEYVKHPIPRQQLVLQINMTYKDQSVNENKPWLFERRRNSMHTCVPRTVSCPNILLHSALIMIHIYIYIYKDNTNSFYFWLLKIITSCLLHSQNKIPGKVYMLLHFVYDWIVECFNLFG